MPEDVERMVKGLLAVGEIDILVNNAAYALKPFMEFIAEEWKSH